MTIYALSLQLNQALPAGQQPVTITDAEWRSELSLALQATLEEGMIAQGRRAATLADALLQQAQIYVDTSTSTEPIEADRFSHSSGHYTETVEHQHHAHHSLSIQTVTAEAWYDLQMGLDEWQDLLTRSAEHLYGDAEVDISASSTLKHALQTCELARVSKLATQFTIVPRDIAPGPLEDYSATLPQLPKKAGELLVMGATTFRLPLYDADPSPFLSGHSELTGVQFHSLGQHFGERVLALKSARLEPHLPAFPNHPGPTLATTAKRLLDAINAHAEHPALPEFVAHSIRHATSGLTEQVQLLAEMIAQTKFAPYTASQDILRDLATQPDDQAMGLSVSQCCQQAYQSLRGDSGLRDALGSLMRAQQLCHPTRLTDIVEEVLREAPAIQTPGLKRD
jgi:hypothetical protein